MTLSCLVLCALLGAQTPVQAPTDPRSPAEIKATLQLVRNGALNIVKRTLA